MGWENTQQKEIKIYTTVYIISLLVIWCLFYKYYEHNAFILKDLATHNNLAKLILAPGLTDGTHMRHAMMYPMYHIFTGMVAYFVNMNYAMASGIVIASANVFSIYLYARLMRVIIKPYKLTDCIFCDAVSAGGVFFVTARCWLNDWRYYQLQCAANAVHNPTTLMVRPFAVLALICFALFINKYEQNKKFVKEFILCAVTVLLSIVAKPVFVLVFLPAMALIVLELVVKHRDTKFGTVIGIMGLLLLTLLFWEMKKMMSVSSLLDNIKFQFGSFSGFNIWEVIKVSLVTFPVPVFLVNQRAFRENTLYRLSILALMIGWGEMFFLTNGVTGDFSWGYGLAVQVATIVSLACTKIYHLSKARKYLAYLVYGYQVFCGVQYLLLSYQLGAFWF